MYYSTNPNEFRRIMMQQLGFRIEEKEYCTLYENPKTGFLRFYQRSGFYDLGIAEYTIPQAFVIQFDAPEPVLRFGIVFEGTTRFQLEHQPVSSFQPSSFLVWEENLKGRQAWKPGEHFYGAEFTIYPAFFEELALRFPDFNIRQYLLENHTYHYLPAEIMNILHQLLQKDREERLNGILLEAALLQCLGIMQNNRNRQTKNIHFHPVNYGTAVIGNNHKIVFKPDDLQSIEKAHDILTEQFTHPPTIEALSQMLLINPQKLKAGFSSYYHMTIGEYTASLKMSLAADLLCTTEKSVAEIASEVGYAYPANFIKKFRQTYRCTPLKYRMRLYRDAPL